MLENTIITGFADEIHKDIKVQVKLLKELEISHLELRSVDGKSIADYTIEEAKTLKNYLDENHIQVSAIGSPIGKIQIADDFEPHFETYKKVVEIAKIMKTPYIRIFSFFLPEGEEPQKYKEDVFYKMKRMVDYAKDQKVILLHENEKDIYGAMAKECLFLFEEFYGANFQGVFDFANFVQCKQDTIKAYELLKPYITYIHIKDALFKDGSVVPAGEGDGNVKEILQQLHKANYSGYLSLEPHLAEFEGLKKLEKNAAKRELTDAEAAFTLAYQALGKLLKEDGVR